MATSSGADAGAAHPRPASQAAALAVAALTAFAAAGCEGVTDPPGGSGVADLVVSPATVQLSVGETLRLDLFPYNAGGRLVIPPDPVTWSSSAPTLVEVDSTGVVRALAEGQAVITAASGGRSGASTVTVVHAPVSEWREHSCAVDADGTGWCWGRGLNGELGHGARGSSAEPVRVEGGPWADVAVGGSHTCARTPEGEAWCWGLGAQGQLGDGDLGVEPVPVAVPGDRRWTRLSAGERHTCGIETDGETRCWGWGRFGQLGNGDVVDVGTPVRVSGSTRFEDVSAGARHTCALTGSGEAWCWGWNAHGQLGDGTTTDRSVPLPVQTDLRFRDISAGARHTCAVDLDGGGWCWGANQHAQHGSGTLQGSVVPQDVRSDPDFRLESVSAGSVHTCGVQPSGVVACWGSNPFGQLGIGRGSLVGNPADVGVALFREVTAGTAHTCGLSRGGTVLCWGFGGFGQLGTGEFVNRPTPTVIGGGRTFSDLGG